MGSTIGHHAGIMVLTPGGPFERRYLERHQTLAHLAEASMARVLISLRCLPAAIPVHLALFEPYVMIASNEGAVLAAAERGDVLAVQADGTSSDGTTWSVQVTGVAHVPADSDELCVEATKKLGMDVLLGATIVAVELAVVRGELVRWSFPS
jgi:hypothetical protein